MGLNVITQANGKETRERKEWVPLRCLELLRLDGCLQENLVCLRMVNSLTTCLVIDVSMVLGRDLSTCLSSVCLSFPERDWDVFCCMVKGNGEI